MRKSQEIMTNGFDAAGINQACVYARAYVTRVENSFRSDEYVIVSALKTIFIHIYIIYGYKSYVRLS